MPKYALTALMIPLLLLTGCTQGEENMSEPSTPPTAQNPNDPTNPAQDEGYAPGALLQAVTGNDLALIKKILGDKSYPIDETNDKQETSLLIATHNNYVEAAKALIDAGADVNRQDSIQDSPYLYAGAQGKTDILAHMLTHSAPDQRKYNRFGGNALIPAAEKGHLDNVRLLLRDGRANIDHQNNYGYTALIEAVALTDGSRLYQDIVQELLTHGANKNLKDNTGKTAADYANQRGYTAITALLNA